MKKILFFLILFSCLFKIEYSIFPYHSLLFFGILGIFYYLIRNRHWYISSLNILKVLSILYGVMPLSIILSSVINSVVDISFAMELIVVNIVNYFVAYLIVSIYIWAYKANIDRETVILSIGVLILFQIIVAIIMFFFPAFYMISSYLIRLDGSDMRILMGALENRPFGLGNYAFFGAGIINSIFLLLISYIILCCKLSRWKYILSVTIFLIIGSLGSIIARTTFIGIILSLFLWIIKKRGRKAFAYLIIIAIASFLLLNLMRFSSDIEYRIDDMTKFGYEMFFNYFESGTLETDSTDKLKEMYVLPDNWRTWLFGDAIYHTADGGYYMHTDVGYLRIIYYGGVIALIIYILYQISLIHLASKFFGKESKLYFVIFTILFLILNLKGVADLSFFFFLLYHLNIYINAKRLNFCSYSNI